eukprot:2579132-Rhodomonas_salina.3
MAVCSRSAGTKKLECRTRRGIAGPWAQETALLAPRALKLWFLVGHFTAYCTEKASRAANTYRGARPAVPYVPRIEDLQCHGCQDTRMALASEGRYAREHRPDTRGLGE